MDRRRGLLIAAAVVAALGTVLVFLYVQGADNRASAQYDAVKVLRAVKQINPGESVSAAQAAGKIQLGTVAAGQELPGALSDLTPINGQSALTTIYPGEQIITSKFGSNASGSSLTIPKGKMAISVNLTDPGRVAGFVNPGDNVAVFMNGTGTDGAQAGSGTFARLLLPKVEVIGVGATTVVSTTSTDVSGQQTTEQVPRTLLTLALSQQEAEKVLYASSNGELALGLLNKDSQVAQDPGVTSTNLFR